jgi:hypothetical protein
MNTMSNKGTPIFVGGKGEGHGNGNEEGDQ